MREPTRDGHVCTHDWPVGGTPVDHAALLRVLALFDDFHAAAVESLARTEVPHDQPGPAAPR